MQVHLDARVGETKPIHHAHSKQLMFTDKLPRTATLDCKRVQKFPLRPKHHRHWRSTELACCCVNAQEVGVQEHCMRLLLVHGRAARWQQPQEKRPH